MQFYSRGISTSIKNCKIYNICSKKDFLPSEIDAIRRALEPEEKAAAKERMSEGGKVWKVSTPSGKARDKIGAFGGVSESGPQIARRRHDATAPKPSDPSSFIARPPITSSSGSGGSNATRRRSRGDPSSIPSVLWPPLSAAFFFVARAAREAGEKISQGRTGGTPEGSTWCCLLPHHPRSPHHHYVGSAPPA
jgi:hypothetical protein